MVQTGPMGWVMVTVGVVLVVLGVFLGGATWGTTVLISAFGFLLLAVGAMMVWRARRASQDPSPATSPEEKA